MKVNASNAMYIGSFDPFTLGHLSIVLKALEKYEKLIICVGENNAKTQMFTVEKRKEFIKLAVKDLPRAKDITVIAGNELTVDIAYKNNINTLVRGIRSETDLLYEQQLAETNGFLASQLGFELETVFVEQKDEFLKTISSSLVRKLLEIKKYSATARCLPLNVAQRIIADELKPLFCKTFISRNYADVCWNKIVEAYTPRPYHNLLHLAYMFDMLNIYLEHEYTNGSFAQYLELILAIFLHDYVCAPSKKQSSPYQNEKDSANFAYKWTLQYALDHTNAQAVSDAIMMTTHNDAYQKPWHICQLIADLDLSILGTADTATYEAYTAGIRKEYAAYSDEEYKKERLAFLFSLLKKKPLFHTKFFHEMLEQQAAKNIVNEIKRLHLQS